MCFRCSLPTTEGVFSHAISIWQAIVPGWGSPLGHPLRRPGLLTLWNVLLFLAGCGPGSGFFVSYQCAVHIVAVHRAPVVQGNSRVHVKGNFVSEHGAFEGP